MKILITAISLLALSGCVTTGLPNAATQEPGKGIVYFRVNVEGWRDPTLRISNATTNSPRGGARFEPQTGDAVYALSLKPGRYYMSEVHSESASDYWNQNRGCGVFEVRDGEVTYGGSYRFLVGAHSYKGVCVNDKVSEQAAHQMFKSTFQNL